MYIYKNISTICSDFIEIKDAVEHLKVLHVEYHINVVEFTSVSELS